jgi:2-haloacid dehalogenase
MKILAFDIFGTVVDWHGSIAAEIKRLQLPVDAQEFATAWRSGYKPAMARVRSGELPWTKIDDLHRMILNDVFKKFHITSMIEDQIRDLNLIWHRLNPWADTVESLHRLKNQFTLVTLSNGNLGLLANMAKRAQLPWDLILSAEVFRHYKPDPETYLGVANIFDVEPEEVMLVASHKDDLEAAHACKLKTAFIERPLEYGANNPRNDLHQESYTNYHAKDLIDLANQLGC